MSLRLRPLPVLLGFLLAGGARAADDAPLPPARTTQAPAPIAAAAPLPPTAPGAPAPPAASLPSASLPSASLTSIALPATQLPSTTGPASATLPVQVSSTLASPLPPGASAPVVAAELKKDAQVAAQAAQPSPAPAATAPLAQSVRRGEDVFARIRRGLGSDVCTGGDNSERWRRRYASNPAAFANRIEQILPLLDFVSVEVERVGLPSEFTFIPLVESWYKPEAMGSGGPAGMWQMIGSTARNHGIHIQSGYDGRLSPVESTRAALSYLKLLHDMFGGWEATVMAYNAGEGRMMEAYKRARSRDASGDRRRPHGLSNITYDYVAKLQALSCLVSQPERNNLALPRASRFVPLAPVLMDPGVSSLEQFADRQGRNASDLRRLNPGFRDGRVVTGVPRLVLMPLGVPQAEPTVRAPASDAGSTTLLSATTPGLQAPRLQSSGMPVAIDASLVSPAARTQEAAPDLSPPLDVLVADTDVAPVDPPATSPDSADAGTPATHRVVAGESLWTIAHLHQVDLDQLRQWNQLDRRAVVRPGQTLKLSP